MSTAHYEIFKCEFCGELTFGDPEQSALCDECWGRSRAFNIEGGNK